MKLRIAWIGKTKLGKTKQPAIQALTVEYLKRLTRYLPTEGLELTSESSLLQHLDKEKSQPMLVLLDSRGKQLSSEELAEFIGDQQDHGTQAMLFAIGPADGFSDATRKRANLVLSLGRMTLAHELARVVLLEQVYRAFTILKKHPYHLGH